MKAYKSKALIWVLVLMTMSSRAAAGNGSAQAAAGTPALAARADTVYGSGWSAAHADGRNTDYSPVAGPKDVILAWRREFDGTINLGPTNDEHGRVYVTTTAEGCHLYALDEQTGETHWCSDEVNQFAVASSALLDRDGHIFLADDEAMHAFDANTGGLIWETPILGLPFSAQFTPAGHLVFVTHIGRIYLVDRDTGQPVMPPVDLIPEGRIQPEVDAIACMRGTEACPSANTPAIDPATGRFFFTFWAPGAPRAELRAMQIVEGREPAVVPLWTNDALPGGSGTSPVLSTDGNRLYVNDNVDGLHAIDAVTGKLIWSFRIGWAPGGSPSVSPEGIIVPTGGGPVMALQDDGLEARLLWHLDHEENKSIATQAAGRIAYPVVGSGELTLDLLVVDVITGMVINRERLPGRNLFTVGTTLSLDGTLFVPTFGGKLYAYRAPTASR